MTIRTRLALGYWAGIVATLTVVGVLVWWQMGIALQGPLETALQTRAAGVLASLENAGQSGLQETNQTASGVFAALFSADGSLIDASNSAPAGLRPVPGFVVLGGTRYLVRTEHAPNGGTVVTGADLRSVALAQAELARILVGVGLAVGAVSLLGGWLLAGRALRPVAQLSDDAAAIGPDDLDRRLAPAGRMDEIGRLTVILNEMLDRIGESVGRQRLFVAMASHELRTPLAALRAELDVAARDELTVAEYRDALREARGDVIRLTNLSRSLLELAASPADAKAVVRAPVRIRELVGAICRDLEPLAATAGVSPLVDVPDEVVWIDRVRVEHALSNLISNALRHGRSGDVEIRGRLGEDARGRTLVIEVLDRGPGLGGDPPDGLFEPFRRGRNAEGAGSGLGLATVASAVRAHGGTCGAESRPDGGARFWMTIPDPGNVGRERGDVAGNRVG